MSATAFQRMRREAEARRLTEAVKSESEEKKPAEPSNKEIMKMLSELGVDYDKRANKATLLSLLEQAQKIQKAENPMDLSECSNDKIKALLDDRGIVYDDEADKETLIKLLEGAE